MGWRHFKAKRCLLPYLLRHLLPHLLRHLWLCLLKQQKANLKTSQGNDTTPLTGTVPSGEHFCSAPSNVPIDNPKLKCFQFKAAPNSELLPIQGCSQFKTAPSSRLLPVRRYDSCNFDMVGGMNSSGPPWPWKMNRSQRNISLLSMSSDFISQNQSKCQLINKPVF